MPGRSLLAVVDDDLSVKLLLTLTDVFPPLTPEELDDDEGPCRLKRLSFLAVSCHQTVKHVPQMYIGRLAMMRHLTLSSPVVSDI